MNESSNAEIKTLVGMMDQNVSFANGRPHIGRFGYQPWRNNGCPIRMAKMRRPQPNQPPNARVVPQRRDFKDLIGCQSKFLCEKLPDAMIGARLDF